MKQQKWYQSPEMIIGLSALVVSLVAVCIGVYSAYIDRSYARASVWPRVEVGRSFYSQDEIQLFEYNITNSGTGPAIVEYAKVTYEDEVIRNWGELFSKAEIEIDSATHSYISNRVIPAGKTINPITIRNTKNVNIFAQEHDSKVLIELCYCSIYNECWIVEKEQIPIETNNCLISESEKFQ